MMPSESSLWRAVICERHYEDVLLLCGPSKKLMWMWVGISFWIKLMSEGFNRKINLLIESQKASRRNKRSTPCTLYKAVPLWSFLSLTVLPFDEKQNRTQCRNELKANKWQKTNNIDHLITKYFIMGISLPNSRVLFKVNKSFNRNNFPEKKRKLF